MILNRYLIFGWGIIAVVLVCTYALEVIKGVFSLLYYAFFLAVTLLPFLFCYLKRKKKPNSFELRYEILTGYFIMYGFVLLTGHTNMVYTYVFPLLSLVILYHDAHIVKNMGLISLVLNLASILRDYYQGKITLTNSRDYEIQIALIVLCFGGCYMASIVYDKLSRINAQQEQEVQQLQEERVIMEERSKYVMIDVMTELGNRRKYEEDTVSFRKGVPGNFHIVMVDINDLKSVNDTLGHAAGDELIVGVSYCIKMAFDDPGSECYRLGGDEFVVISMLADTEFLERITRLRRYISHWKGIHVKEASISIGTASSGDGSDLKGLYRLADERMYEDKEKYYMLTHRTRRSRA